VVLFPIPLLFPPPSQREGGGKNRGDLFSSLLFSSLLFFSFLFFSFILFYFILFYFLLYSGGEDFFSSLLSSPSSIGGGLRRGWFSFEFRIYLKF